MGEKAMTADAIALTEKKVDMALDDIIKMSKKPPPKGKMPPRPPNKSRGFLNGNVTQGKARVECLMDYRSSVRQGVLAQRRSNFRGNQFPIAKEAARMAITMPIRSRVNWNRQRAVATPVQRKTYDASSTGKDKMVARQRPQTLDALFADMKEQRMRAKSQQTNMEQRMRVNFRQTPNGNERQTAQRRRDQQQRVRGGFIPKGNASRSGNFAR